MRIVTMSLLAIMAASAAQAQEAGDVEAGRRVFAQCRACHLIDNSARNGVGPNLYGIMGRRAGQREGFRYSANMQERAAAGLTWDDATLRAYVANPKAVVPQGSMTFAGLRNPEQINNLMAFLAEATRPAQ
ncbi:cytochrome c family protein [Rhodovarius crocodyli]|uniref:Cytochrome c family protein n=1 Tax=Rhodovarius crocodyli TaxID=1979269 RepID=A0A437MNF0_9PROT|nr:cytochrome c family protein [Rhodovarius crocodyli]RVT99173.1 cytochrome c family protein [Rhodovarius crocodyli]